MPDGLLTGGLFVDGFEGQGDLDQLLAILRHFLQPSQGIIWSWLNHQANYDIHWRRYI